jgi:hypothetical protein
MSYNFFLKAIPLSPPSKGEITLDHLLGRIRGSQQNIKSI